MKKLFITVCFMALFWSVFNNLKPLKDEFMAIVKSTEDLIATFEGKRNTAYQDTRGFWTIGIGHMIKPEENHLINAILNDQQVFDLFISDLNACDKAIEQYVKVPLNQNQYDALFSLCYNIGDTNFKASSLVRVLNTGDYVTAANHFMDWVRPAILTDRRKKEKALFLTDI